MRAVIICLALGVLPARFLCAQHCPWDCAGMIILQTGIAREIVNGMKPVLTDSNKNVISDTIYGTGKETFDRCDFLYYDDFVRYRTKKIAEYQGYRHDTLFHFAEGNYIVRFNFCEYREQKLYLRYIDPYSGTTAYSYLEIPPAKRIHLHDHNKELRQNETARLRDATKNAVLKIDCKKLNLQKEDCQ